MTTQPFLVRGGLALVSAVLQLSLGTPAPGRAAEIVKTNNSDNLNLASGWTGGVAPTSADVAAWRNSSSGGTLSLGSGLSWGGLIIGNPSQVVNFSSIGGFALTLGTSGIDLSAATVDFTMTNLVTLGASQTWNVALGRTLVASGAVSGIGMTLTKDGAGTLTLGVANGYSGGTTLNAGTVRLGSSTSLGTGTITLNGGALASVTSPRTLTNHLVVGGDFTLGGLGNALTLNGTMDLGAVPRVASIESATTVNGVVSGTGGLTVNSSANRQLTMSAANTYLGSTVVNGATLRLTGSAGSIGSSTGVTINNGATLTLDNLAASNNLDRIGNVTLTINGGTFEFANNGGAANYSEAVSQLNLSSGDSTVSSGQAAVGQSSALTFGSFARSAGASVNFNGTGLGTDARNTIVFASPPALDDGIIGAWATVDNEFASYTSSVTALQTYDTGVETGWTTASNVKLPAGTTTLTANRQVNSLNLAQTGATLVDITSGKTLRIESGGILTSSNRANVTNGTLTAGTGANTSGELNIHQNSGTTMGIGSVIANNGSGVIALTKSGPNTLSLFGANTFTGGLYFNGGRINFNHSSAAGTGTITVSPGADDFVVSSGSTVLPNNIVLRSGARPKIYATIGDSLNLTNGVISGPGGLLRDDTSLGNVTLGGANTFTGGFTITGSNVRLGNPFALGTGTYTIGDPTDLPTTPITNSARTQLTGANAVVNRVVINQDFTVDGSMNLEFSNTISLGSAARTITVSNTGDTIFSGPISGAGGGINKAGSGTLILNGTNNYSGATVVSAGTLGGSGVIAGPVGVSTGGLISPGNGSLNTLTINSTLAILGGAVMDINKASTILTADRIVGVSTLTQGGTLTVTATGSALTAGDSFDLFDATNIAGGFTAFNLPAVPAGRGWDTSKLAVDGTIKVVITAVPVIKSVIYNGATLAIAGSGGVAFDQFRILSSNDLTIPIAGWTQLTTGTFDLNGNFNFPISVTPAELKRFYILVYP